MKSRHRYKLLRFPFSVLYSALVLICAAKIFDLKAEPLPEPVPPEILTQRGTAGNYWHYFLDPDHSATHESILEQHGQDFSRIKGASPNFGYTNAAIWLRLILPPRDQDLILEIGGLPSRVDLYLMDQNHVDHRRAGSLVTDADIYATHRNVLFLIPESGQKTMLLRFEAESIASFPLYFLTISDYIEQTALSHILLGSYAGVWITIICFSALAFFMLKDYTYIHYLFYVISIALFLLAWSRLGNAYLWPNFPHWYNRSATFFSGLSVATGLIFIRSFFSTIHMPRLVAFGWILFPGTIVSMILTLFSEYSLAVRLTTAIVVIFFLYNIIISINAIIRGYRPAIFFLIGWTPVILLVTSTILCFVFLGVSPPVPFYLPELIAAAFGLEMIFFAIALIFRMRRLKHYAERTEAEQRRTERLYLMEQSKSHRLELETIKRMIQPHFLMNSLTVAIALIHRHPERAALFINALANELRAMMQVSAHYEIPIEEEIKLCQMHMESMKYRLGITAHFEIICIPEGDTVPPLIFHTLIENAFTHHQGSQSLTIQLEGYRKKGTTYRFTVRDLKNNNHIVASKSQQNERTGSVKPGTGLKYVALRLREVYGDHQSLTYEMNNDIWTVTIHKWL